MDSWYHRAAEVCLYSSCSLCMENVITAALAEESLTQASLQAQVNPSICMDDKTSSISLSKGL